MEEIPDPNETVDSGGVRYRHIPGYNGYSVNTNGDIYSHWTHIGNGYNKKSIIDYNYYRKLNGTLDDGGYLKFCIRRESKPVYILGHQLVLLTFIGPVPLNKECCHKNDIHNDNRLENLYYGTKIENMEDKYRNNPDKYIGENHGRAKLKEVDIFEIRKLSSMGKLGTEIAKLYNVNSSTIYAILNNKNWQHTN